MKPGDAQEPAEAEQEASSRAGASAAESPAAADLQERPGPAVEPTASEWERLQDRYLRLAAEFENHKKRTARDHQARVQAANADLLLELLEVVDNFERALSAEHEDSQYARGVTLIYEQLKGLLARQGVTALVTEGERFDPEIHEALLHVSSADVPTGQVCQDLRRGYRHHGRILRPAQVAVSKGPAAEAATGAESKTRDEVTNMGSGVPHE